MRSGRYMSGHTAMSCVKKEMHRQFGDEILLEEEKHSLETKYCWRRKSTPGSIMDGFC